MSVTQSSLLHETENYVQQKFDPYNNALVFHNIDHTRNVVRYCKVIASHYDLSLEETMPLLVAAWFHDLGYVVGIPRQHEDESARMAEQFLRDRNEDPNFIETVKACIMATRMPQSPSNLLEQIICDADMYHLGTSHFEDHSKKLRQEINSMQEERVGKKEWRKINIEFLQRHRYFTDFCRERLEPVKQKHLSALLGKQDKKERALQEQHQEEADVLPAAVDPETVASSRQAPEEKQEPKTEEEKEIDKLSKKFKQAKSERGIVAMFRIMSENHISLSQMADSKANIMISVNTIVMSIMVSVLLGKLQFYPEFIIPTLILMTICLGAVVFAILATRPNVSSGTFTKEDIQQKKINLLFFGNFYNMKIDDYDWAMKEMMQDKEYLYGSMIKDMYFLGVVLARKYKFLRISYNIFMFGLIAALVSFGIAFIVTGRAEM